MYLEFIQIKKAKEKSHMHSAVALPCLSSFIFVLFIYLCFVYLLGREQWRVGSSPTGWYDPWPRVCRTFAVLYGPLPYTVLLFLPLLIFVLFFFLFIGPPPAVGKRVAHVPPGPFGEGLGGLQLASWVWVGISAPHPTNIGTISLLLQLLCCFVCFAGSNLMSIYFIFFRV